MTDTIELESVPETPITETPITATVVAGVKASRGRPKKQAPLPGPNGPLRDQQALKHVATLSEYHAHGWRCCLIEPGAKGPNYQRWNVEPIQSNHVVPPSFGIGLLHVLSNTCAIDIDDYDLAKAWLAERGVDLDQLLNAPDAVRIISGRVGSDKLICSMPATTPWAPSKKVVINGKTILEFRSASADGKSLQDILPVEGYLHIHAKTEYEWKGDWRNLPPLPEAIQKIWSDLLEADCSKNVEVRNNGKVGSTKWTTIVSALQAIDPDSARDPWRNVGMALADAANQIGNSEEAFATWVSWSSGSPKFKEREMAGQWRSFKSDRPDRITVGTLFHYALEAGWKFPDPDLNGMFGVVPPGGDFVDEAIAALKKGDWKAAGNLFSAKVLGGIKLKRMTNPEWWAEARLIIKESRLVKMEDIDRATMPDKVEKAATLIKEDEPWPVEVDGADLLDELVAIIRRYVVTDEHSLDAAALWTLATYFVEVAKYAPILNMTSPVPRCGKSTTLYTLSKLVFRAVSTGSISSAAIYRIIDKFMPCLLIDEVDTFLNEIDQARGIINLGVEHGGKVTRTVGDDHEPVQFNVFGFKALAGIGKIANTLIDRSIKLRLNRKFRHDKTEPLRHANERWFDDLRSRCTRFAQDNLVRFKDVDWKILENEKLHDRANQVWEPLFIVAKLAGAEWFARANVAAIDLSAEEPEKATNLEMLASVRRTFVINEVDRMPTEFLIESLTREPDGRWAGYNRGMPIKAPQVAHLLEEFRVGPKLIRFKEGTVCKALDRKVDAKPLRGYEIDNFMQDAFNRYLPPLTKEEVAEMKEIGLTSGLWKFPKMDK